MLGWLFKLRVAVVNFFCHIQRSNCSGNGTDSVLECNETCVAPCFFFLAGDRLGVQFEGFNLVFRCVWLLPYDVARSEIRLGSFLASVATTTVDS